jgi:hypothetical protein
MWGYRFIIIVVFTILFAGGHCQADRLPNATPENQVFFISTLIDVIGMVDDHTTISWDLSNRHLNQGILGSDEVIGSLVYHDSVMTNGGHLMLNKNVDFDSSNKGRGAYNLESQKVLTYESVEGSHLVADEMLVMNTAGNYSTPDSGISCVFGSSASSMIPAFCTTVSAKSSLININSAQVSTSAKARLASASGSTPAGLSYHIDLTPNPSSGTGYATGTAMTEFTVSSLETRGTGSGEWNRTASENTVSDRTHVTGGIIHFSKAFDYGSGISV